MDCCLPAKMRIQNARKRKKDTSIYHQINEKSEAFENFRISANYIKYIGDKNWASQLLSKTSISTKSTCQFRILSQPHSNSLGVGITDQRYIKEHRLYCNSPSHPNFIYFSGSGRLQQGNRGIISSKGTKFNNGDYVKIKVNQKNGQISLYINENLVMSHVTDKIKDKRIIWVPYFDMQGDGTMLEFIG